MFEFLVHIQCSCTEQARMTICSKTPNSPCSRASATHSTSVVLALPPSDSCSKRVSLESRNGTCRSSKARALMHMPRVVRERFMDLASVARCPTDCNQQEIHWHTYNHLGHNVKGQSHQAISKACRWAQQITIKHRLTFDFFKRSLPARSTRYRCPTLTCGKQHTSC